MQRRLRIRKEPLSGVGNLSQLCLLCGGPEETLVHKHVGCAHSRLLWPHYRQALQEAVRHVPPETRRCGWLCGAPQAPSGGKSSALGWCPRRQKRSSAQLPAMTRREGPRWTSSSNTCSGWGTSCGSCATTGWSSSSALLSAAVRVHRWLTAAEGNCPPPPPHPGGDFVASLRIVNGTLECPPQEDRNPYQDLPGGFAKYLQGALCRPWISGRSSMTAWEAHIGGAEWAREWSRWCATTCAPRTPVPQYASVPLE